MSNLHVRFSEPSSAQESARADRSDQTPLPCDKESSDLFLRKLEEKNSGRHDLESGESRHDDQSALESDASPLGGMTSPLESLFSGRMEQVQSASPAPAPAEADGAGLAQLVERILVSTPENGGHEVRLSLGSHTLPGTEVILQRDAGGMLSVTLASTDASAFQTLVASQGTLKTMLENMENNEVRVTVTRDADREDNDAKRRSRGYMEATFGND